MGRAVSWDETGRQKLVPLRQFLLPHAFRIQKAPCFVRRGRFHISLQGPGSFCWAGQEIQTELQNPRTALLSWVAKKIHKWPQSSLLLDLISPGKCRSQTGHQLPPTGTLGARKTVNKCWRGQGRNWNATLLEGVKNRAALVENSWVFLKR